MAVSNGSLPVRVGYTVGRGTGEELADVFEKVMKHLAKTCSVPINLQRLPRTLHSYNSLVADFDNLRDIERETVEDVTRYERFCRTQVAEGTRVLFRTAINAQSLYLVRQRLQAVKVDSFGEGENSLLLVRDESQGFYSGANPYNLIDDTITRNSIFSKALFGRIITYSLSRAHSLWGVDAVNSVQLVYKFHLFDGVFSTWGRQLTKQFGLPVTFIQPDTANRNLLATRGVRGRQLMIAGNEWADIMHVVLLDMFGQGNQETRCTENVYLHPDVEGLTEFQTVHGLADDLEGTGRVNPTATLRAAASIMERYVNCDRMIEKMERALEVSQTEGIVTADQGGKSSTDKVVDKVLQLIAGQS